MHKVHEIDWSSGNIFRAGILPIYDDGNYRWIGLGISNFSTNITAIGGCYESKDHDLLDTAIREYNEEVGNNLDNVTLEDLLGCSAIVCEDNIQILLPISMFPSSFVSTEELYDMLWITTKQLQEMLSHPTSFIPGSGKKTRAYIFAREFRNLGNNIINVVDNISMIRSTGLLIQSRPKKVDMRALVNNTNFASYIKSTYSMGYMTISKNKMGVAFEKGSLFIFPIEELTLVTTKLLSENIKLMTNLSREQISSFNIEKGILVLENILPCDREDLLQVLEININELNQDNEEEYIKNTLILMREYEVEIYNLKIKEKICFDDKRALALTSLNRVNKMLSQPLSVKLLREKIGKLEYFTFRKTKLTIDTQSLIDMWINTNVIHFDKISMTMSIPK